MQVISLPEKVGVNFYQKKKQTFCFKFLSYFLLYILLFEQLQLQGFGGIFLPAFHI